METCKHVLAVTPSNTTDLVDANSNPVYSKYVYIGGTTGTLKVDTLGGETITLAGVAAGALLPLRVKRIYASGTTATNISVFY